MIMHNNYIYQNAYLPDEAAFYETIFVLSNGRIGIRPTVEFKSSKARPGMYISGIYDYAISVHDQLVNVPNCTDFSLIIDGQLINLDYTKIVSFQRKLDMHLAILTTDYSVLLHSGNIVRVTKEEFLTYDNEYYCKTILSSEQKVRFRTEYGINYGVGNNYHGGYIDQDIKSFHNKLENTAYSNGVLEAKFKTVKTQHTLFYSSILQCHDGTNNVFFDNKRLGFSSEGVIQKNSSVSFVWTVRVSTSGFSSIFRNYEKAKTDSVTHWEKIWKHLPQVEFCEKSLTARMKYSLYQCASAYSELMPLGANIPPRGLSSGYHHGHFFFNTELYMVPFFTWFYPDFAKSLLFYRINTLDVAKETARQLNCSGAFWSEESGLDGRPAGPTVIRDYVQNESFEEWTGRKVKHISADVLYACRKYVKISGDEVFERLHVTTLASDVVDYYLSIVTFHEESDTYSVNDVIGPDEYHIGINNNFFTNYMILFCLSYYIELVERYHLFVSEERLAHIKNVISKISRAKLKNNVIEQFDGYFDLDNFTVTEYMKNGLPRIPPDMSKMIFGFGNLQYNIVKQCDVIMLLSMFPHHFDHDVIEASYDYYEKRTIHESSLSTTHAGTIAAILGRQDDVYKYLRISSGFNLDFEPKTNYNNGIHYAANAGAWLILLDGLLQLGEKNGKLSMNMNMDILSHILKHGVIPFYFKNQKYHLMFQSNYIQIVSSTDTPFEMYINDSNVTSDSSGCILLSKKKEGRK